MIQMVETAAKMSKFKKKAIFFKFQHTFFDVTYVIVSVMVTKVYSDKTCLLQFIRYIALENKTRHKF